MPGAAESWDVSADGTTYTFHLRAGVQWSDGTPLVAGDFVSAWQRLVDPATGSQYADVLAPVVNAAEILAHKASPATLGVNAPDARTHPRIS